MQARTVPIWKGAMSPAWDQRGAPIERSQPFTTRQMNINPCTTMATQHDPGTGGYNSMDSTCISHDTCASGPTANYTGSAGGPKELASYTGHITAWVSQSSGWNGLVQSRSPVPERNGSAHENGLQNRHMGSGEGHVPDSQRGCRREELKRVGGNAALETTLYGPMRHGPLDLSVGQSESRSTVPALSASQGVYIAHSQDPTIFGKEHRSHKLPSHTHRPAPHPATLKFQAMSNNNFTDALIHDFIAERLDNMMAELNQSKGCKGAEGTRLSSSNLNVGPPSKQNTGSLSLKMDYATPLQFTSTATSEAVGLSSAGNAGSSSALDGTGNKQLSTAFGKGIPGEHAELTRNVENQDGHAKSTPGNCSKGTPDTALNNAHTVYINECAENSPDFYLTKLLDANVCETGGKHVLNDSCDDKTGDIVDADYYKPKICHSTLENELNTVPILLYTLVALKELVTSLNSISYEISSAADAEDSIFDVIVRCYWNGNKDDVHVFTSTEYPQIMKLAAAVCAKNEDENPVILSAVSGTTLKEYIERDLKVGNNVTEEEYKSSWLNVNKSLDDLDKEPGVRHQMSFVCHPEEQSQDERINTGTAEEHTKMDTADSIKMSVLSVREAPSFKSQKYEDISDGEIQNGKDMAIDLQSNTLPSETTSGNLSGTSFCDRQVYEDISDAEVSTDESLIIDEPLVTPLFNNVKQPNESQSLTNYNALAEKPYISTSDGTINGHETLLSPEKEFCPNSGMNLQCNKGPGFGSSSVIYISSDEDQMDFPTEGDGHTDTEMQESGTEVISSFHKIRARPNFPPKHKKATSKVPFKMRSCSSPHIKVSTVESTKASQCDSEVEDAEEDWVVIPVSIPNARFDDVDGGHVAPAKTKSIGANIPRKPSTTKKPSPASSLSDASCQLPVFDTMASFLEAKTCNRNPDFTITVVSDELLVPKPTEGNLIPTEPINGNIGPRCRKRSSSCDTEDSCDYSSSQSTHNYLTISPQCRENGNHGKSLKRKKMNLHSAKSPCTNALSDSTEDSCVDDVQESPTADLTAIPEAKSSPIESDKDNEKSVEFKKGPTKCQAKTNKATIFKGLKRLTADGAKLKKRRAKCLPSESEDSEDDSPVLQKRHLAEEHRCQVKGPQQMISPGSTDQERPCVAGAKECVSSPNRGLPEPSNIIPRYIVRVPSDTSEPLKLVKEVVIHKNKMDDSKLSRGVKKTSQCNLANGHQRNEMTAKKLQSSKSKTLGSSNGEQKTNALNTGQPFTSSKPSSVSKEHLMTSSSSGTEPPRTASSSGTEPPRTASFYEHATRSPTETSPSTTYSRYPSAPSRKRISHLTGACTKEKASCSAQRTASSKEAISRRANKTHDSKHQEPPSTSPASRLKLQLNSSNIPSKLGKHPFTTKEGTSSDASGSTKVSARKQVASEWQHSYFPTAIERRHSSGPEEAQRHTSTSSQNASELAPHNAAAGLNMAKQKHNFIGMSATPLMKKTKAEAKRLTKDRRPDKVRRMRSVGDGYKWGGDKTNGSRKSTPSSPEYEHLSQW